MVPWSLMGVPQTGATVGFAALLPFGLAVSVTARHLGNLGWGERRRRKSSLPPVERVQRLADEMRALYASIYEPATTNEPLADQVAALVAKYAPTNAPDLPPPNVIDWEMIAEEGRVTIAAFREALIRIQQMLAEQDDEDALLVMLLAD